MINQASSVFHHNFSRLVFSPWIYISNLNSFFVKSLKTKNTMKYPLVANERLLQLHNYSFYN